MFMYTKKDCFEWAIAILTQTQPKNNVPVEEVVSCLNKELDRLNRPRSLTSAQIAKKTEREALTTKIYGFLAENGEMTISQIMEKLKDPTISNQRINSILSEGKHNGLIIRTERSRKPYFDLAKKRSKE